MDVRKVVVTLVCATSDAEALDDVVDGLSASGREVGLVSGVDEQPRRMAEAVERCGDTGLLVVCASPRLGGATLRKLEGLFSARRGPNHAMIRVEVGPPGEMIAAILRGLDGFLASQGRVRRHPTGEDLKREVVGVPKSLALPVVRLAAGEELDGDTRRIQLPDNPKAAELSRRRRVVRERERERERITQSHRVLEVGDPLPSRSESGADAPNSDKLMVIVVIGAGILAVIGALMFSGVI